MTRKSCGYVTDYCLKKFGKKKDKELYESVGLEAPFQLCSQGLGLDFALANSVQLRDNLGCTLNGRAVGLPRYYVRKLDIDTDIMREVAKNGQAEKVSRICRRLGVSFDRRYWELLLRPNPLADIFEYPLHVYLNAMRKQQEETYKSKKRVKKGVF